MIISTLVIVSTIIVSTYLINKFSYSKKIKYYPITSEKKDLILKIGIIGDSWAGGKQLNALIKQNLENSGFENHVIIAGQEGAKSKLIYKNIFKDPKLKHSSKFIIESHPDYCIVIAGVNDSIGQIGGKFYAYHLSLIIKTLLHYNIKPIIVELPEFGITQYTNQMSVIKKTRNSIFSKFNNKGQINNIKKYRKDLSLSLEKQNLLGKIIFIKFDEVCTDFNDCKEIFRPDGIHLNLEGNTLLSEAIANELIKEIR